MPHLAPTHSAGASTPSTSRMGRKLFGPALLALATLGYAGASWAQTSNAPFYDRLPANIKSAKVIKMVGDSFAPYRVVGDDGKTVSGIDAEMAKAMEAQLGVKIELHIVSNLPAMLAGIDTGRYDISGGPLLSTEAREKRYDIVSWMLSKPAWVIPVASGRKTAKLLDLCGLRVAFPAGSAQEEYSKKVSERCVAAKLPALSYVPLTDQNATVLAIQAGRADACGIQLAAGLYLQHRMPGKFNIQTDETDALGILNQGYILKKDSDLSQVWRDALQEVWNSGEYAKIMDKWSLSAAKAPAPVLNPSSNK